MRLEPELWEALEDICRRERQTLGEMVKQVEQRGHPGGRTSAVRVFVLGYFRDAVSEDGHRVAGHGTPAVGTPAVGTPTVGIPPVDEPSWSAAQLSREVAAVS